MKQTLALILISLLPWGLAAQTTAQDWELMVAADSGQSRKVMQLLKNGANANASTPEGTTPLMYASQNGHRTVVEILLMNGAQTNARPDNGVTALHSSVLSGFSYIAELLLEKGAQPNVKDQWGVTPLHYSVVFDQPYICELLLRAGAKPGLRDSSGKTALALATHQGNLPLVKILHSYGAGLQAQDNKGYTPAHIAAQQGHWEVLRWLHGKQQSTGLRTLNGYSVLDVAVKNDRLLVADSLLQAPYNMQPGKINLGLNTYTLHYMYGQNDTLRQMLKSQGGRLNPLPLFNEIDIGLGMNWNFQDFMFTLHTGLHDTKWNFSLQAQLGLRPFRKYVLEPAPNTDEAWQYREQRFFASAMLDKYIKLNDRYYGYNGPMLRAGMAYSRANYTGTAHAPAARWMPVVGAGYVWEFINLRTKVGYQYQDFAIHNTSPHRVFIEFSFRLQTRQWDTHSRIGWL